MNDARIIKITRNRFIYAALFRYFLRHDFVLLIILMHTARNNIIVHIVLIKTASILFKFKLTVKPNSKQQQIN